MDMSDGPGKFQGEPTYVQHYWTLVQLGMEDDTILDAGYEKCCFKVSDSDVILYPDLLDWLGQWVAVWASDAGFIYHARYTLAELNNLRERSCNEQEEG